MAAPTIFILNYINQLGNTTNYFGPENMPQGLGISLGSNFPPDSRLIPGLEFNPTHHSTFTVNPTFQGNPLFSANIPAATNPASLRNQAYSLNPTVSPIPSYSGNLLLPTNISVPENPELSENLEFSLNTRILENPPTQVNLTSDRPIPTDSTTKSSISVSPLIPTSTEPPLNIEVSSLKHPSPNLTRLVKMVYLNTTPQTTSTTENPLLNTNISVPENPELSGNSEFSLNTTISENPPTRVNLTSNRTIPTDSTTKSSILVSHTTSRTTSTATITSAAPKEECFPQPGTCGQQNDDDTYESHNSFTKIDRNPWNVLLEYNTGFEETDYYCGGTLITNRYVITAASCVVDLPEGWSLIGVRLGEWDIDASTDCEDGGICADPTYDITIEKIIPHEEYIPNSTNFIHNIALLRLASRIRFTKSLSPICLPTEPHLRNVNYTGIGLEVAGWARSFTETSIRSKLRDVVNGITLEECNTLYNQRSVEIQDSQICFVDIHSDVTCTEDVGGPLTIKNEENTSTPFYYLAGIGSINVAPCDVSYPGVYTRVGSYIDWIENLVC